MSRLELDPEEMRRIGHLVVDRLVDLTQALDREAVFHTASPADMASKFSAAPTDPAESFDGLIDDLVDNFLPYAARWGHPRNFAYVPGRGTWPGALAELIACSLNIDASAWRESPGPIAMELAVLDWFRSWVGMPAGSGGILVGGGSAANLTAIVAARTELLGDNPGNGTIYCSSEAHSSVTRAAAVAGFARDAVRVLPVGDDLRLDPDALEAAVRADKSTARPAIVVATAGTTGTGAIDPLSAIADVAERHGMWFHIDGAYGGFSVLTDLGRRLLDGIERADSVTLDPHKWLFQPIEVGALLVRDPTALSRAFTIRPGYLQDTQETGPEVSFTNLGMQQTRSVRALKIWLSLRTFGLDAFRSEIQRGIDLAGHAQRRIKGSPAFELITPASLSILCFRRTAASEPEAEALNSRLVEALLESGVGFLSSTRVHGRYALRLCILNHSTTVADVDAVLDFLERG